MSVDKTERNNKRIGNVEVVCSEMGLNALFVDQLSLSMTHKSTRCQYWIILNTLLLM